MARDLRAAAVALCALILAGCAPDAPPVEQATPPPPPAATPAPVTVTAVAHAVVDALPLPTPKLPERVEPCVPDRAIELIIAFEVGSPELYTRKYTRPVWPGAASGATVGLGYDLGHQRAEVILIDWEREPHHVRLASAAGITGPIARNKVRELADISIDYGLAREVFDQTSLIEHCRIARRVFVPEHFDALHGNTRGALVSLVFNRGGSMTGRNREEMRAIRDDCMPRRDRSCVAAQIRAMVRIWVGGSIEAGMRRRREAEAQLAEAA